MWLNDTEDCFYKELVRPDPIGFLDLAAAHQRRVVRKYIAQEHAEKFSFMNFVSSR